MDTMEIDRPTTAVAVRSEPSVPASPIGAAMAMIERIMTDASVMPDRLHSALEFYERMQAMHARRSFDEAMASAKQEMPAIVKDRAVFHGETFKYKHEDLAGIAKTIDPILTKHGLSYRFRTSSRPGEPVSVTCIITGFGYSEETTLSAGADASGGKNSIQAIGSAVTYLQRYTLKAALGLAAAHDDDGGSVPQKEPDRVPDAPVDHGDVRISSERVAELVDLIASSGSNLDKFLKFAKAPSLVEVRSADFSKLKAMLLRKAAQKKEAAE